MLIPFGILSASAGEPPVIQYLAGYFAGGSSSDGGTGSTTVDKFAFPADTRSTLATGLGANTARTAAMANSNVAGYVGRENNSGATDKFAFATDARTILGVGIEFGRSRFASHANSGVAGYFAGGRRGDNGQATTRATKYTFATDSVSNIADAFEFNTRNSAGFANSGVAGYLAGGFNAQSGARTSVIRKMNYTNDSNSSLGATLSDNIDFPAGMANSGVAGYAGGGIGSGFARLTTVNKLTFSSETRTTLGTGLSVGRFGTSGMAHSGTAGYFGGGIDGSSVTLTTVDKFAFPGDTRTTLGTGLSSARTEIAAMASSGVL